MKFKETPITLTPPWESLVVGIIMILTTFLVHAKDLQQLDPLVQPAEKNEKVTASVLIDVSRAGQRIVAVGERGIVIYSDDNGTSWTQAEVPVSVTLTSVYFVDDNKGWAVGHSGVVIASSDGGRSWQKQLDGRQLPALIADVASQQEGATLIVEPGDPLLDVYFQDQSNGFVIGAFGLILKTTDGGQHWQAWHHRINNPDGNHLYQIKEINKELFIVGERGSLFSSKDNGEYFHAMESPYEGSYFGLSDISQSELIIYGLRGHVYHSSDQGQNWVKVNTNTDNAWTGATTFNNDSIVLVGQGGDVLFSNDRGKSFSTIASGLPPLSSVCHLDNGRILVVGMRGVDILNVPANSTRVPFS